MTSGYEPGEPTARDLAVLAVLQNRDGTLTEVALKDGRRCRVWNIAWGYDAGDRTAHITTNVSPDGYGEDVDFFYSEDVALIVAPESGETLLGPVTPSASGRTDGIG